MTPKNLALVAALLLSVSVLHAQKDAPTWKTQGEAVTEEGKIRIRMKITKSSPAETIMAPQLLILDGSHATMSVQGPIFPGQDKQAPAGNQQGEAFKQVRELLRARNFWQTTGRESQHDFSEDQMQALEAIASDSAGPARARLRAAKLLCDRSKQVQVEKGISQADAARALAEAFVHIEDNLHDDAVSRFAPDKGFDHLSIGRQKQDPAGIRVRLESTDSGRAPGGLSLRVDPKTWQVTKAESWGQPRGDALRIDVVKAVGQDKVLALVSIFQEGKVVHCESLAFPVHKPQAPDAAEPRGQ
jgi:hypothetical protein